MKNYRQNTYKNKNIGSKHCIKLRFKKKKIYYTVYYQKINNRWG